MLTNSGAVPPLVVLLDSPNEEVRHSISVRGAIVIGCFLLDACVVSPLCVVLFVLFLPTVPSIIATRALRSFAVQSVHTSVAFLPPGAAHRSFAFDDIPFISVGVFFKVRSGHACCRRLYQPTVDTQRRKVRASRNFLGLENVVFHHR